jgi:hypothetical protein
MFVKLSFAVKGISKRRQRIDPVHDGTTIKKDRFVSGWEQRSVLRSHIVGMMNSKQRRIELAKKIISNLKREMQKPRLTESVRRSEDVASEIELSPARSKGM